MCLFTAPSKKEVGIKADEEQLKILDDVPNSAVEMIVKEKVRISCLKNINSYLLKHSVFVLFFVVFEKIASTRTCRRRSESCIKTALRQEAYNEGRIQRYTT